MAQLESIPNVEKLIHFVRGRKVMLDSDLASLYGVPTKILNKAISRNRDRFPGDFMFQVQDAEFGDLRFQIGTSSWGGRRHLPYAFTEEGVAMLSGVLRSKRAVQVNIEIMRAFVRLRHVLSAHKDLAARVNELERKYEGRFKFVFKALRELLVPAGKPKPRIGFKP